MLKPLINTPGTAVPTVLTCYDVQQVPPGPRTTRYTTINTVQESSVVRRTSVQYYYKYLVYSGCSPGTWYLVCIFVAAHFLLQIVDVLLTGNGQKDASKKNIGPCTHCLHQTNEIRVVAKNTRDVVASRVQMQQHDML